MYDVPTRDLQTSYLAKLPEFQKLNSLYKLLMISQKFGSGSSFDFIMPVDSKKFINCFNHHKSCNFIFHRDVDPTGGLNY